MTIDNVKFHAPVAGLNSDTPGFVEGTTQVKGDDVLLTADMTTRQLLGQILIELKKLNLRQEEAFEEQVNDGDV